MDSSRGGDEIGPGTSSTSTQSDASKPLPLNITDSHASSPGTQKIENIVTQAGSSETTSDPYIITFAHPSASHLNPKSLPAVRKYLLTTLVSLTSFTRILISTLPAPALPDIAASLKMSSVEAAMSMSIYLLATALGPLLISPLSELYGRSVVLHATNLWFLVWNLSCGLAPSKGMLLASRFMAGCAASAAYAVGNGVLADIWNASQRGKSLGYYSVIPLIGAAAGPIIGGVMADHLSWRWIFYATSIFQALLAAVFVICFRETYEPTILARHAARLRKQHGDCRYTTPFEQQQQGQVSLTSTQVSGQARNAKAAKGAYILYALTRPLRLLLLHPVVQICGLGMAVGYGTLYIILTSLAGLFTDVYSTSTTASGLHYLAAALGELVAAQAFGPLMDWFHARQKRKRQLSGPASASDATSDIEPSPEDSRMPLVLWTCLTPCIGLLVYGWSATYKNHWFVVDFGVFLAALGLQMSSMPRMAYLVDAYPQHVSSAIAASQFLSSMAAFSFPLFTPALYRSLGYGWGNTVIATMVAGISLPGAWVLWRFGVRMRGKRSNE